MCRACVVVLLAVPTLSTNLRIASESVEHAHVRPLAPLKRQLLEEAQARSLTIRDLVKRLERSDVVVYVACDVDGGTRANGRIYLHTVVGGFRYLVMRIRAGLSRSEHVITLGHELQHAVEIASMPSIVEDASLAQAYRQIGFVSAKSGNSLAFETVAALQVGDRVRREFVASSERDPCARATREPPVLARPGATSLID
jgi:hypothetical protein